MQDDIRHHLVDALAGDLVGPYAVDEELKLPPSRWYLTGFLVPRAAREELAKSTSEETDPTADDDIAAGDDDPDEDPSAAETEPKQRNRLPASMGMSVLLPPGSDTDTLAVIVQWAEYLRVEREGKERDKRRKDVVWRRVPRGPIAVDVPLAPAKISKGIPVSQFPGLHLKGKLALADMPGLPKGTRALSLFVVNDRAIVEKGRYDEQFMFQVQLSFTFSAGIVARPNQRDGGSSDPDDRVADLQFRDRREYAVGHGVSVLPSPRNSGPITTVQTTWVPAFEVKRVVTFEGVDATVSMEALASLADGGAVRSALATLPQAYGQWIERQRALSLDDPRRAETRDRLMADAKVARDRIQAGIERLATDPEALLAFRLANRAMATQARRRSPDLYQGDKHPRWRLFQLAFVLLNISSIVDDRHPEREIVELIFFPTGGGKTEAYLGVIAFTLLLRRMKGQNRADRGLGVAILLRYTLRLLTLDQLGRAATLVCALEMIRREHPPLLGDTRFAVGLWVGRSATANTLAEVSDRITDYKTSSAKNPSSPFPLTNCPWCRAKLGPDSLALRPNKKAPTEVVVGCLETTCDFNPNRHAEGLPVLFVDEQIYRELPAFVIATVDKFAMLPWRGETGMLFGRVTGRKGRAFVGPLDDKDPAAERLPEGLRPPELIVQDELHLISGPLGTMVGLYETAVEALCTRVDGDVPVRPKILASTATVRRASDQICALMGRDRTRLFPPPGPDESETFFARVDHEKAGRLYVGVAAPGRSMKGITLRTYIALLSAAARAYESQNKHVADAYMTLVGYFNSLRELGGTRRLVEDEIRLRCQQSERRKPENAPAPHRWQANRLLKKEPIELTSREKTSRIAESKTALGKLHTDPDHVDVVLASNMISVGVDIDRLGLMVIAGQPKTTAEYIQASSRVGRQEDRPGLVVTCLNLHKPRDRSHYEQFPAYHDSFYRFVEVTSLTPFSAPALDRGMAATLVAMTRLLRTTMMPPSAAMDIEKNRSIAEGALTTLIDRAVRHRNLGASHDRVRDDLLRRGRNLIDAWISIVTQSRRDAGRRSYSPYDRARDAGKALLFTALEENRPAKGTEEAKFCAPTSMRDVERTAHFWLERRQLGSRR